MAPIFVVGFGVLLAIPLFETLPKLDGASPDVTLVFTVSAVVLPANLVGLALLFSSTVRAYCTAVDAHRKSLIEQRRRSR
ncbi:hypothetical protein EV193_103659 [Herbihabitans rhizosphaerae]|uniref:Uncharacterized protein n=1 Tax=Herbihabitans rhizosphaerae TaxID=1872711 RepID=A0A4Q7KXG0_9PSEU|nr:hypothetical protein [Herbihabitans rhizosphaerae]RZS41336.1 hypothetical protein EV193_103659 [Herbihabitans rhizosphaerae]